MAWMYALQSVTEVEKARAHGLDMFMKHRQLVLCDELQRMVMRLVCTREACASLLQGFVLSN
jgi:hypothetical protein